MNLIRYGTVLLSMAIHSNDRRRFNRRRFLKWGAGTVAGGAVGAFGYTWRIEPHWIQFVRRTLAIKHLPESLLGATLVHISDLHIGETVDETYIAGALHRISNLKPDILVITGDFMTHTNDQTILAVRRVLGNLQPARLATLAILGNHDYGRSFSDAKIGVQLANAVAAQNILVLRNQIATVDGLHVVGIDDRWGPNFHPEHTLPLIEQHSAAIVLCHNPDVADLPVWSGYKGWILCGHTHGGQCRAPFFGPPILPVQNKRYSAGEIDLLDGRRMYINRGLGYLYRVRFNARPEITVFTLQRDEVA